MKTGWEDFLSVSSGEIRLFHYQDLNEELPFLESLLPTNPSDFLVITHRWKQIPSLQTLQEGLVQILAESALSVWPYWYGNSHIQTCGQPADLDTQVNHLLWINRQIHTHSEISKAWLEAAVWRCLNQLPPFLDSFPLALQVSQLSMAIHPFRLFMLLVVEEMNPSEGRLLGLAKSSEWLARNAETAVLLIVPESAIHNPELDSLLYLSQPLKKVCSTVTRPVKEEEQKHIVWPIIGQPHPLSPGEQLLARKLSGDLELSSLFGFNQRVKTVRNNQYLVDLLWVEGRIIVEIDGYGYHSARTAFIYDRQRDYELLISGYRILRLDHDELISDAELALEKIRDVVHFVNQTQF